MLETLTSHLSSSQSEAAQHCLRIEQGMLRVYAGPDTPDFDGILEVLNAIDPQKWGVPVNQLWLRFLRLTNAQLQTLSEVPWFADVQILDLSESRVSSKGLTFVHAARGLRVLDLSHVKIGRGVSKLSGLTSLESLFLGFSGIDAKASVALGAADLPSLRCLDLGGWGAYSTVAKLDTAYRDGFYTPPRVERDMVKGVFAGGIPATLRELRLRHLHLDRLGCAAFGRAGLHELQRLEMFDCKIDLFRPVIRNLPSLRVLRSNTGMDGEALTQACFLPTLECLDLSADRVSWSLSDPHSAYLWEEGSLRGGLNEDLLCSTLAQTPCLRELRLVRMGVGRALVDVLVEHGPPLSLLSLPSNRIDDYSVELLGGSAFVSTLRTLALSGNPIKRAGVAALAAAPLSLHTLSLRSVQLSSFDIEPLWSAHWIPGLRTLYLTDNRLDAAVVPSLLQLPSTLTLQLRHNFLGDHDLHQLEVHFGVELGSQFQQPKSIL